MSVKKINTAKMLRVAQRALKNAYAPYSNYKVGACVMAEDGSLFGGCNVENASYGITSCAETTAICSMITAGKKHIAAMLLISQNGKNSGPAVPCGRCRQFIREFADKKTPLYLCNACGKIIKTTDIDKLLPMSFGPEFLIKSHK